MNAAFWEVTLVIWRECVEAMLAVGVLNAWLSNRSDEGAKHYLWGGVISGIVAALVFATLMMNFAASINADYQEYLQLLIMLVAALLILQTLTWMGRRGRPEVQVHHAQSRMIFVLSVAFIAFTSIFREGFEAAIFTYGVLSSHSGASSVTSAAALTMGVMLSLGTYGLLQSFAHRLSWKNFFLITKALMLCLAASLLMSAIDKAVGLGVLDALTGPLWDSRWLLDDTTQIGSTIASLTGYRARPELLPVLVYVAFWLLAIASTTQRHRSQLP